MRRRISFAIGVLLFCSGPFLHAHDPDKLPSKEQVEKMRQEGTLDDSLLRVRWVSEHKLDSGVNNRGYYRLRQTQLKSQNKSETEVANELYDLQRAFPYSGRLPELKSTGSRKTLTILVDFKDHRANTDETLPGMTSERISESIYGGSDVARSQRYGNFESVRVYYKAASEGKLDLTGNVLGWHSLPEDREAYEPEEVIRTPGMTDDQFNWLKFVSNQNALYKIATAALDKFESDGHDFSQYDNDNDGDVDLLTILYAGDPGEWSSFWWAYRWAFQLNSFNKKYDGKKLNQFVFQFVDVRNDDDFDPRTLIHETGHALGLPDYYDYDGHLPISRRKGPDGGVGRLDMMDGNWGNHNAFSRWLLDWIEPKVVGAGSASEEVLVASAGPAEGTKAIAVFPGLSSTSTAPGTDMFIVEYRQRVGNDGPPPNERPLPADGVLVWRVDGTPSSDGTEFKYNNSDATKKLIRLLRSGKNEDFPAQGIATASDFFVDGQELGPLTKPSTHPTNVVVTGIQIDESGNSKAKLKVGFISEEDRSASEARLLGDSELLRSVKEFEASSDAKSIRLSDIDQIVSLAEDSRPEELRAAWNLLSKGATEKSTTRELEILTQNLFLAWSGKDGLEAAKESIVFAKLQQSEAGSPNTKLYSQVMTNWARVEPAAALDWAKNLDESDPMVYPGSAFSEAIAGHLQETDVDALKDIARNAESAPASLREACSTALLKLSQPYPRLDSGYKLPDTWRDLLPNDFELGSESVDQNIVPVMIRDNRTQTIDVARLVGPNLPRVRANASPTGLNVCSYNLESGEAKISVLADEIAAFSGIDVWGFSEVEGAAWADQLEDAAGDGEGAEYDQVLGTTGGSDRLLVVYNTGKLDYVEDFEIHQINPRVGGQRPVRSALVVRLRLKATGQEFLFMVNHLYRGRADRRHEQSRILNEWGAAQQLPVIAVGDYNYDWDVVDGDTNHDKGYDNLIKNDVFRWVRPGELIKTQKGDSFNSVLDFVFITGDTADLAVESTILVRPGDVPDTAEISDHRPVVATFSFPSTFNGPNPQFVATSSGAPMIWEEVRTADIESMDAPALRQRVRDLEADLKEAARLAAGQD
jgi:M6 family metalloprotease-like protein